MSLEASAASVDLGRAARVWARVAALSFGGPAAQIGVMHRILVEEQRWISPSRFQHALNFCMLLPGPEAMQLATYVGWLLHGPLGGMLAGGLFIAPGIVAILALSWIYASFGHVAAVGALFFGLKAAVLAVVLEAVGRLARRSLRNPLLLAVAAAAFIAIFFFAAPFPAIVIGAGLIGFLGARARLPAFLPAPPGAEEATSVIGDSDPAADSASQGRAWRAAAAAAVLWLAPIAVLVVALGPDDVFSRIALFFSRAAVVTFGGAYAVLAYVAQRAVDTYGWLKPGEMLDGLGLAETTPGPLIMVLQFVGFMAAFRAPGSLPPLWAGTLGGLLATWVTFAPCFLWIFLGAPFVERLRGVAALSGALAAIGAAVVGVILNLAIWFAIHAMFARVRPVRGFGLAFDAPAFASANFWAIALAMLALLAVFRWRLGIAATFGGCAAIGLLLHALGFVS
jgi:chromate transporter